MIIIYLLSIPFFLYLVNFYPAHLSIIYLILSTGENVNSFCKTFSFIESGKTLSKFDKDNELNALYGFKFLTMMVVLLGHRLFYVIGNPMNNPKYIENVSHQNIYETNYFYVRVNILVSYRTIDRGRGDSNPTLYH